jgi:hypothetical protein
VTVGLAFLVLAALMWWRGHGMALRVTGALGASLVLAGLVVPGYLGPVYRAWMQFALLLSKVTTPIFMGVVYFLVITPIGLLRRLVRRTDTGAGSTGFWKARTDAPRSMARQF